MIVMRLELTVPETSLEPIYQTLRKMIGPTEVLAGCKGCYLVKDPKRENTLIYTEEWETESDVTRRIRSPQFKKILATMECSREQPELRFYKVANSRGLEVVEQVLGNDSRKTRSLFGSRPPRLEPPDPDS